MTPPLEFSEPRRSFVKKTLATSVSISFAGLIRAHGEEGGGTTTTTYDPQQSETTTSSLTTTYDPQQGETTTSSLTTTYDPQQTEATTESQTTVNEANFKLRIENREIIEMDRNTFHYLFYSEFSFVKPPGFDQDPRVRSPDFVAVEKTDPTSKSDWSDSTQIAGSIIVKHKHNNGSDIIDFSADLKWNLNLIVEILKEMQPLHVDKDCLKCEVKAPSLGLTLGTPSPADIKMNNFQGVLDSNFKVQGVAHSRGVTAIAVKKETPVDNKPPKIEALVNTPDPGVLGSLQSPAGSIRTQIEGTIQPADKDANSKTVTWKISVTSQWAAGIDVLKNNLKNEIWALYGNDPDKIVEVNLSPVSFPVIERKQSVRAYFAGWIKAGSGCSL